MAKNDEEDLTKGTKVSSTLSDMSKKEQHQKMTYRYSHDEMMAIRESKLSRTRPEMLSKEFDNDDGLFSPDKWLQHRWQCEGVENRKRKQPNATSTGTNAIPLGLSSSIPKALTSILEAATNSIEFDHQTSQTTQLKRGIPLASHGKEEEKHPSTSVKSRWRQGQLNNGVDFKPAFQKSALEANSRSSRSGSSQNNVIAVSSTTKYWEKDKNRRGADRERTRSSNTENEQLPEWMDEGPATVNDIIELKGFDDDPAGDKKRRRSRGKESSLGPKSGGGGKAGANRDTSPGNRNSTRQKRHSGGDVNNHSRPQSSRQTPQPVPLIPTSRKNSSHSPIHVIQASDLESSILREQQEKFNSLNKETADGKKVDVFALLGIQPSPSQPQVTKQSDKIVTGNLPNSDAEFAAFILGLSTEQIANKPGQSSKISSSPSVVQPHEPATSRLSRFFVKNSTEKASSPKLTKESPLMTKSQLDLSLSALQAELMQRGSISRQSFTPPIGIQYSSQQQRPASTEQRRQSPIRNLLSTSSGQLNKFPNLPLHYGGENVSPDFNAQREAILQQMQGGHVPVTGREFHAPYQSSYSAQEQQYYRYMDQILRKRVSPALAPPFIPGQRPSSAELHHQMLQSPSVFAHHHHQQQQRQSPLQPMPPPLPAGGSLSAQFQHILMQTARQMLPNPNMHPDLATLRSAFMKLQEDPNTMLMTMNGGANAPMHAYPPMASGSFLPAGGGHSSFQPQPPPNNFFGSSAGNHFSSMPHHYPLQGVPSMASPSPHAHQIPRHFVPSRGGMLPETTTSYHSQQHPYQMTFPPPMSGQPQKLASNNFSHNPNLLNSPAFMPTSVMRQMSKAPGNTASGSGPSAGGSTSNTPTPMFLHKLFGDQPCRAILGQDPNVDVPPAQRNSNRISGCLKLEDIEQRELDAYQKSARNTSAAAAAPSTSAVPNPNQADL